MIRRLVATVTLMALSHAALAQEPQCTDRATLQSWKNSVEKKYSQKKFSTDALKKLYMATTAAGMEATLFNAPMFKDKILMGNLAIDCHNNLVKALKPKNKNRQLSIELWQRCTHRLYGGKEKAIVDKAVTCLKK